MMTGNVTPIFMRKTSVNDDVMTTREAGETLGVAVRTIQLWVEAGVLPAWRTAGGHRRIARSAVEKLLAGRKHDLAPDAAGAGLDHDVFKVLLVEDDVNLSRLFTAVVGSWNLPLQLTLAGNGFEGLVRIGEMAPDLVVTDLVMPGMDGFAMLRALKKPGSGFSGLQIVVVSALSSDEIAAQGGLPDGVAFFQKPVDYPKLEALVRQAFAASQKNRLATA
jgi:excisionase family DNA binding protein